MTCTSIGITHKLLLTLFQFQLLQEARLPAGAIHMASRGHATANTAPFEGQRSHAMETGAEPNFRSSIGTQSVAARAVGASPQAEPAPSGHPDHFT